MSGKTHNAYFISLPYSFTFTLIHIQTVLGYLFDMGIQFQHQQKKRRRDMRDYESQ